MSHRTRRWHLEYHRRALYITREPNPNCPACDGNGGAWVMTLGGPDWDPCHCLSELRIWRLPLWRQPAADSAMEAPF